MTNGAQLTKNLSIGHILTTIALVVGGFTFVYDLRESIAILQFKGETVEQRLDRIVERTDSQFDQIMDHLVRIEDRLDSMHSWNDE